jgi:hypothetical protein
MRKGRLLKACPFFVDLFHRTALEHGGTNEGEPGIRAE